MSFGTDIQASPAGGESALSRFLRLCFLSAGIALLAACSLPRGAAQQSEILKDETPETPSFQVVQVTRNVVDGLAKWPVTGWSGSYHWLTGTRGPSSSVIHAGDRVNLLVWDSQEVSLLTGAEEKSVEMRGITVSPNGEIFVPYIDTVVVNGLTPDDARARVQTLLEEIVPSAQVQLSVEPGQRNSVDLVGGVSKPGSFPLPSRDYSILSLIATSGGIKPELRNPLVRLIRAGKTYEIRAETLFADASRDIVLRGGDKVLIQEDTRSFTALGASGTEDIIYFPKERISALEAVSLMGGLSDSRADPKGVLVLREYSARQVAQARPGPDMQQVIFAFDLTNADGLFAARNFSVNPGDTVLATESPVTKARTIFGLVGSIFGLTTQVAGASTGN